MISQVFNVKVPEDSEVFFVGPNRCVSLSLLGVLLHVVIVSFLSNLLRVEVLCLFGILLRLWKYLI